jgi:hypothetical protein
MPIAFGGAGPVEVNWLQHELPDPEDQRKYAEERCIVVATEALAEAVERSGVTHAEIARRLSVSPARVSHMLSQRNLTLRSVADLLWACGLEVEDIGVAKLGVSVVPSEHAAEWTLTREYRIPMLAPGVIATPIQVSYSAGMIDPTRMAEVVTPPQPNVAAANNNLALAA